VTGAVTGTAVVTATAGSGSALAAGTATR
jgi:hypothetical protein